MNQIICADAVEGLKLLSDNSVFMCVTSPPYYGLRDYGMDGQIGTEESPQAYISRLIEVFREVRRVLRDDGTLWINIADCYAGSGKGTWNKDVSKQKNKQIYHVNSSNPISQMPSVWDGIKPKDLIGIPWMLAFALRRDGWYLRSDIIWQKTNCMPENVKDRPTKSYEHIFLLSKSKSYYYDGRAIMEPLQPCTVIRYQNGRSGNTKYNKVGMGQTIEKKRSNFESFNQQCRNKRDVWSVSTNSYRVDRHFAMYPERLIEPCVLAGSPVGGIVLDPFFGSGTTGAVAKRLGRQYIGIDLNPEYCELARKRIEAIAENEVEGEEQNVGTEIL